MPTEASQIGEWLKGWLSEQRKAGGFATQLSTVGKIPVGYGVVTSAEQGRPPELANFLNLIIAYKAEDALVKQIREWRSAGAQLVQGSEAIPEKTPSAPEVPRAKMAAVETEALASQKRIVAKKSGQKPGAKDRRGTGTDR